MSIIECDRCGGYYELEEGESLESFDSCQCGGSLKYAKPSQKTVRQKNFTECRICGHIQEKKSVICSKCGSFLRRNSNYNRHDYSHVLEQSNKKSIIDRIEWWGIASGIIFLIVAQVLSSIFLFGGLFRLASHDAGVNEISAFFSGSMLVSVLIMILSGFVAVATIKTRDYVTGIINGGFVGAFIGVLAGTFALIIILIFAGIIGQQNAGIIGGVVMLIFYTIIYGALTASGGLIAVYVRRHTSII